MRDLDGGVFVSRIDAETWVPDDKVGGSVHMLFEEGGVAGGLWKNDPSTGTSDEIELPARETIMVLRGTVSIDVRGGPTLELGVGDIASMPKGAVTVWRHSSDFEEFWVYS